jgi:hypothetical protein
VTNQAFRILSKEDRFMNAQVKGMIKRAAPAVNYAIVALAFAILGGMASDVGSTQDHQLSRPTKVKEAVTVTEPVPQAALSTAQQGPHSGLYCLPTGGVSGGVHDLGFIFQGQRVIVQMFRDREGFDPVAVIRGSNFDLSGRSFVVTDDDSGGDRSPRFDFIAPFSGNYVMQVREFNGNVFGCYSYRIDIFD